MDAHLATLKAKKAELTAQAVDLRSRGEEQSQVRANIQGDLQQFAGEYHRLNILTDLTAALSDETWVSEFQLRGNALSFSGCTKEDVSDVIKVIRVLPWAAQVDLEGPGSFDSYTRFSR
ncbi:hypothetical protein R0J87_18765, partial [Halomonas sp. SIMBA_159]